MFDAYIKKEYLVKKRWDYDAAGISICQFTLPVSAEKVCLFSPECGSKFDLVLLFCQRGQMTVCRTDTPSYQMDQGRILILSNTLGTVSLQIHKKFSGTLVSLNLKQVQDIASAAWGIEWNMSGLLRKLESQCGLMLFTDPDWNNGIFDRLNDLPEPIYGQCCFLKMLEFLLSFDVHKWIEEISPVSSNPAYNSRSILSVQAYMKEHLSEKITIADLSRIASLSPTYLKAEFRRACGKPIHCWLVELRMQRAAERIRCTELPIYQIAQEVGYESMSQFTSAFRKQYGVTPGKYKKMSKAETECPIP